MSQLFRMSHFLKVFKTSVKIPKKYSAPFYSVNVTGTFHWAGQLEMSLNQFHALLIHELIGRQDLAQHGSAGCECFQNLSKTLTPFRQNTDRNQDQKQTPPQTLWRFLRSKKLSVKAPHKQLWTC